MTENKEPELGETHDKLVSDVVAGVSKLMAPKKPREKKPRVNVGQPRQGTPIYLLYSGKIAIRTERGWVEANPKVAKSIMIGDGLEEPVARDYANALPPAAGITFDPKTTEPVIETDGERWLNTFSGMPPVGPDGDCSAIEALFGHLVNGDLESYEYFLDWLAAPLQALYAGLGSKRNLTAVVLVGNEGTGKGLCGFIIELIYGSVHIVRMDQTALEDLFTPTGLESALFVIANEVTSKTNRGDEHVMNKMKEWITEDRLPVRRMHTASQAIRAHFNMLFTTNNDRHPVKLSDGDRRYSVFNQPDKLPDAIRDAVLADRAAGSPQVRAFAAKLLKRTITRDLTKPFENEARDAVKTASREPATAFANWLVEVGIEVASTEWVLSRKAKLRAAGEDNHHTLEEESKPWSDTKHGRFVPARIMSEIFSSYCAAFYPKAKSIDSLPSALAKVGIPNDQRQKYRGRAYVGYTHVPASSSDATPPVVSYSAKWEPVRN